MNNKVSTIFSTDKLITLVALILLSWAVIFSLIMLDTYFRPTSQLDQIDLWNSQNFFSIIGSIGVALVAGIFLLLRKKRLTTRVLVSFAIAFLTIVLLSVSSIVGRFNSLVYIDQNLQEQATNLRAAYQLRVELLPSLLEMAREPLQQEREIQLGLVAARDKFADAQNIDETITSSNQLETVLRKLILLTENYPSLRDTKEFQYLQQQITSSATTLTNERVKYNSTIKAYNVIVLSFPMNIFAKVFGYSSHPYWDELAKFESNPLVTQ